MNAAWIGGLIGTVIGIAGGLLGTFMSIRNTSGPRERAFMIRAAALFWLALAIFLTLLFTLPAPYRLILWVLYGLALIWAINYVNKKQQAIKKQESET